MLSMTLGIIFVRRKRVEAAAASSKSSGCLSTPSRCVLPLALPADSLLTMLAAQEDMTETSRLAEQITVVPEMEGMVVYVPDPEDTDIP